MKHKAKLVIFDVDGTLMNSIGRIIEAMQISAKNCNVDIPSEKDVKNVIGITLRQAIATLSPTFSDEKVDYITNEYKRVYKELEDTNPAKLFPSTMDTLVSLKDKGLILAIATGKSRHGLQRIYNNPGLRELIDYEVCGDMVKSKPDPMMLNKILEHYGFEPSDAIMVGDSNLDLRMAKNAGVKSIGITWGVHSKDILEQEDPIAVVNDISDLLDLIES